MNSSLKLSLLRLPLVALPLSLLAAGCADMESDVDDVGTAQSAICSEGAADKSGVLTFGDVGNSVSFNSNSRTYGSATCSGRFLVEATNTNNKPNLAARAEVGEPVSQALCGGTHVNMEVHAFDSATGSWTQIGTYQSAGQWIEYYPGNFMCSVGTIAPVPNSYSKVRVGAKAWQVGLSVTPLKVIGAVDESKD